jgi:aromatic ring hydroxylase
MATVITDKTDFKSIEEIISKFKENEQVDVFSSAMSPIEKAIVFNKLKISNVIIQKENNTILFILNNSTILHRQIDQIKGLANASNKQLENFENMGDGVLWNEIPEADTSLKSLIQEELANKFNLQIA